MCLGFVFGTMVQLAFVLLLKYCDAWRESKDNKRLKTSLSSKPICQIAPISCNNIKKGRQAPKVNRDLTERKNHGIGKQIRFSMKILGIWQELPFTVKVDFATLFLFHLSFWVVNCIYWVRIVWNGMSIFRLILTYPKSRRTRGYKYDL